MHVSMAFVLALALAALAACHGSDTAFEGDIQTTYEQVEGSYGTELADALLQAGVVGPKAAGGRALGVHESDDKFWKHRGADGRIEVFYNIHTEHHPDGSVRDLIRSAMDLFEAVTGGVRFVQHTHLPHQRDYIEIMNHKGARAGCWSELGRQGNRQELNLNDDGCITYRTIQHELMHALGFWHEQSRSDRDSFVEILLGNVIGNKKHNFEKGKTRHFGGSYDYDSIMHYELTAFSANDQPTIRLLNSHPQPSAIGHGDSLSPGDIFQMRQVYPPPPTAKPTSPPTRPPTPPPTRPPTPPPTRPPTPPPTPPPTLPQLTGDKVAAVRRWCRYNEKGTAGVLREVGVDVFGVSCFDPVFYGDVPLRELRAEHSDCSHIEQSRTTPCVAAVRRWCNKNAQTGHNGAGVVQEVGADVFGVACFDPVWYGNVALGQLTAQHSGCSSVANWQALHCVAAVSRWCLATKGAHAGVIQEFGNGFFGVACFAPTWHGDALIDKVMSHFGEPGPTYRVCFPKTMDGFCRASAGPEIGTYDEICTKQKPCTREGCKVACLADLNCKGTEFRSDGSCELHFVKPSSAVLPTNGLTSTCEVRSSSQCQEKACFELTGSGYCMESEHTFGVYKKIEQISLGDCELRCLETINCVAVNHYISKPVGVRTMGTCELHFGGSRPIVQATPELEARCEKVTRGSSCDATRKPTLFPTSRPTTAHPTARPTKYPTTGKPTLFPTSRPTTAHPTARPTKYPTTGKPTLFPTSRPTTAHPTARPTMRPTTAAPTQRPSSLRA